MSRELMATDTEPLCALARFWVKLDLGQRLHINSPLPLSSRLALVWHLFTSLDRWLKLCLIDRS